MATNEHYSIIQKFVDEMDEVFNQHLDDNRLNQIKAVKEKLSLEHAFIRLFIDYDYQVCNGGHVQYVGNGYHSTEQSGFFQDVSDNCNIHEELISLSKEFFKKYPVKFSTDFIKIIEEFHIEIDNEREIEEICLECQGSGCNEENEDEDEDCYECDGSGEIMVDNPNRGEIDSGTAILFEELDDKYYKISDNLIAAIAISIKNRKISESFNSF